MRGIFAVAVIALFLLSACYAVTVSKQTNNVKIFYNYEDEAGKKSNPRIVSAVRLLDPREDVGKYDVVMRLLLGGTLVETSEKTIERESITQVEERTVIFPLLNFLSNATYTVEIIASTKIEYYLSGTQIYDKPVSDTETGIISETGVTEPPKPSIPATIRSIIPKIFLPAGPSIGSGAPAGPAGGSFSCGC